MTLPIFYALPNWSGNSKTNINRPGSPFIASREGRHNNFNINMGDLKDAAFKAGQKIPMNNEDVFRAFVPVSGALGRASQVLEAIRIGTQIRGAIVGLMDNGYDSIANREKTSVPYLSQSSVTPLGKNEASYHKTFAHVGRRTSSAIKNIAKGPFVEKEKKSTSISSEDYQDHNKRRNLILQSGFNEKGFSWLTEDTYFSVSDYMTLFDVEKRFKEELSDDDRGTRDIYGCVFKTYNQLKIKNLMSPYTCHVRIHLVKILDLSSDVRSLVQEITHNSSQNSIDTSGRIPKDLQYTTPNIYDFNNRFSINFLTNLSCSLSLSSKFKEKAKIVKSWNTTLAAGSIWDFNLTTHMGRGIHINTLWDLSQTEEDRQIGLTTIQEELKKLLETDDVKKLGLKIVRERIANLRSTLEKKFLRKTNEHPTAFVLVLEYVGDRRATIQRNKDKDLFSGYSPVKLQIEFETNITYLTDQNNESELLVYKRQRQEKNFKEGSIFENIFCPDREIKFHVSTNQIGNKKAYSLIEDGSIFNTTDIPSMLQQVKETFQDFGLGNFSNEEAEINPASSPAPEPQDPNYTGAEPPTPPSDGNGGNDRDL